MQTPFDSNHSVFQKILSPISIVFYTFVDKLVWKGFKKYLNEEDVFELPSFLKSHHNTNYFMERWKYRYSQNPSDRFLFFKVFLDCTLWGKHGLLLAGIPLLIYSLMQFASPLLLNNLLFYMSADAETESDHPNRAALLFIFLLFFSQIICGIAEQLHWFISILNWVKIQGSITCAVYQKMLRMSSSARSKYQSGEIINLMSSDAFYIGVFCTDVNLLWSLPLQVIVSIGIIFYFYKFTTIAAIVIIMILFLSTFLFASLLSKLQEKILSFKDERLKIMNEIIKGIKIVKFFTWEKLFQDRVMSVRNKEYKLMQKYAVIESIQVLLSKLSESSGMIMTFALFSILGGTLTSTSVFSTVAAFSVLAFPLYVTPTVVSEFASFKTSCQRLQEFFSAEEIESVSFNEPISHENAIEMLDCSFSWNKDSLKTCLEEITLTIPKGAFICITGRVGGGKTSLLHALFGDCPKVEGIFNLSGSIAYCDQNPWIINATITENILLGETYSEEAYQRVLESCQLVKDLNQLEAGDLTEIGENGRNLSGGQKARVSLARACYANRDIYLLDSTLNAVDAQVQSKLLKQCLLSQLQNKTRILATHSVQALALADQIIVIEEGKIIHKGTYSEVKQKYDFFAVEHEPSEADAQEELHSIDSTLDLVEKLNNKVDENVKKLTQIEEKKYGSVNIQVLWRFWKGFSIPLLLCSFSLLFSAVVFDFMGKSWLSIWASNRIPSLPNYGYVIIFVAFGLIHAVLAFFRRISFSLGSVKSANSLHGSMLFKLLRSPMQFFDSNPSGRIINRLSKDQHSIDFDIMFQFDDFLGLIMDLIFTLIIICFVTPLFILLIIPLFIVYAVLQVLYRQSAREIRRLESIARSPVFSHFTASIEGSNTIRAYHYQQQFCDKAEQNNNHYIAYFFTRVCLNRWLGLRLQIIASFVVLFSSLLALLSKSSIDPSFVGLSLTNALNINYSLLWIIRTFVELESNMTSCERVVEYCKLEEEAPATLISDDQLSDNWPHHGSIEFKNVHMRYRKDLDLTLKGVDLKIEPGHKIGIVGRTGAGKSSMVSCMMRFVEIEIDGSIEIDGVNIASIGLEMLRKNLICIPQDPILFSGTIRSNLDPFNQYLDNEIWKSLERVYLKDRIEKLTLQLDEPVSESGSNLSSGEKQLLFLAKCLLRSTKVILMDEASAFVDNKSDSIIQKSIREHFKDCTCVVIAHRLSTIIDYDRICYMEDGRVIEFDTPYNLLSNPNSKFSKLVDQTGGKEAEFLRELVLGK